MGVFTSSRQVSQNINLMTPWWLSGASIDLDFDQQRYYDSSLGASASLAPLNSYLSISRASTGYAKNAAGTWIAFGNDTMRITDLGLLVEDARTNYLLNSETPATQTTTSLGTGSYTLWVEGSGSATPSAGTATITGAGPATSGAPDTFTVTGAGTVTVTVSGSLTRFQLEAGAFASSYIPTAGATATRAADAVTTIGGLNTILIATTASAIMDIKTIVAIPGQNWNFLASTNTNLLLLSRNGDTEVQATDHGGSISATRTISPGAFSNGVKVGIACDGSGFSITGNGLSVGTSASPFSTHTGPFKIGSAAGNTNGFQYFRRLTVWNSKLADATLQSLTAP